jgi:protein arginine kinase activator
MLCDICKKNKSSVHLTQIVDGKMHKVDLCEACAKEKGIQEATGFSLDDLLVGLGGGDVQPIDSADSTRCPSCGLTHADFKKTGRLGCSVCWETFSSGLAGLLKAMHKGERHVGKVPRKAAHTLEISEKIKELTSELEKAVREEKYEDAAHMRDQIRALEAKLNTVESA